LVSTLRNVHVCYCNAVPPLGNICVHFVGALLLLLLLPLRLQQLLLLLLPVAHHTIVCFVKHFPPQLVLQMLHSFCMRLRLKIDAQPVLLLIAPLPILLSLRRRQLLLFRVLLLLLLGHRLLSGLLLLLMLLLLLLQLFLDFVSLLLLLDFRCFLGLSIICL
jgi:hypothetical protein